jgi:hypothetical protein
LSRGVQIGLKNSLRSSERCAILRRGQPTGDAMEAKIAKRIRHESGQDARAACWRMPAVDGGLTGSTRALGEGRVR